MSREEQTIQRAWTLQEEWQQVTERSWSARGMERIRLRERAEALREACMAQFQRARGALALG